MLSLLPIVSATGWWPDWGLLMLVAWRLLRADAWPAWWAAPLGFANDLIVGNPIGLSVALWAAMMIAMDILDRRTMWRDYWIEWGIAALFIAAGRTGRSGGSPRCSARRCRSASPPARRSLVGDPRASRSPPSSPSRIDRWRLGPMKALRASPPPTSR